MDKTSFTNYAFLIVAIVVFLTMLVFSTPLGSYVVNSISNMLQIERSSENNALKQILHVDASTCNHSSKIWMTRPDDANIQVYACDYCGKVFEARISGPNPSIRYGDANGDDVVNSEDLALLKEYQANYDDDLGTSSVVVSTGADVNADGKVDGKDVLKLGKALANVTLPSS